MSDDLKNDSGSIPPRVTLKVPGQSGDLAGLTGAPSNKKKTARIPLDQASGDPGASGDGSIVSKTIRLAPALTGQVAVAPLPSIGKALTGTFVYDEAKRQTSRIPLEAAMPAIQAAAAPAPAPAPAGMPNVASTIPKTIKVKRPTITLSPAAAAAPVEVAPPVAAPSASAAEAKSQTARVDMVPEVAQEVQQTQKKTIKIRRDGAEARPAAEARNVTIARLEGEATPAAASGSQVAAPHWAFVVSAAAALLVLCFMLYVMVAQAYPSLGWSV